MGSPFSLPGYHLCQFFQIHAGKRKPDFHFHPGFSYHLCIAESVVFFCCSEEALYGLFPLRIHFLHIRHTIGMKEVYAQRKETVERLFGTAKENHGLRYTQMIGKARMEMKVGLTFACMNLKKLAKMIARKGKRGTQKCLLLITHETRKYRINI